MIQTAVGIEWLGSTLRIAVVREFFGRLKTIDSSVIENYSAFSSDRKAEALSLLAKRLSLRRYPIFLSLPPESGIIRQMELPVEVLPKLKSAIALQIGTLSPWEVSEVYWDFAVERPAMPVKAHNSLKVTISIVPKEVLDPLLDFFNSIGLSLSGVCLAPIAWAHLVAASSRKSKQPLIVVAGDSDRVYGVLIRNGWLTPVSLNVQSNILGSIKAVNQRLMPLARVEPGIAVPHFYHDQLSEECRKSGEEETGDSANDNTQRFSGAVAASLACVKRDSFQSNLIPRPLRYARNRMLRTSAALSAGLCVLLGLALFVCPGYESAVYLRQLESEIQRLSPSIAEVARSEAELNALNGRYALVARVMQNRDRNLEALRELAAVLPPSTWLTNYTYQDGNVTLSGLSENASQVEKILESSTIFSRAQFVSPITREASGRERFVIRASVQTQ